MKLLPSLTRRLHIPGLIGSFIAASILWLYVQLTASYEDRIDVPLRIENLKEGKTLKRPIPPTLKVLVEGPGMQLMALRLLWSGDMYFLLDLATINEYWQCPTNNYNHWLNIPPEVERVQILQIISPDTIYVELDDYGEKSIPVVSDNISVNPESGYMLRGPVTFQPESILVSGPQSLLRTIKAVQTIRQDFTKAAGTYSKSAVIEQPVNPLIKTSTGEVQATYTIERISERTFNGIPVTAVGVPRGVSLRMEPGTIRVVLHGGEDLLKNLNPENISATITYLNDWKKDNTYQLPVQITSPGNLLYFEAVPGMLNVTVE